MADRPPPHHTSWSAPRPMPRRLRPPPLRRPEDPNCRRLIGRRPHCHEQPVELGYKQRGARSRYCRHSRKPPVARFNRFEHIDDTLAAAYIDTAALAIDEHIIGITAGLDLGDDMTVLAGERHQARRTAKDDEDLVRLAIDRHRKIRSRPLRRQRTSRSSR